MRKRLAGLKTPRAQLAFACCVTLVGGYLIAMWVMGLLTIIGGLLWAADALLRDVKTDDDEDLSSHQALLRRYQNSP